MLGFFRRACSGALAVLLASSAGGVALATPASSEFAGYNFHFAAAEYNFQTGQFVIPHRFRATRRERTIEGDRVTGNALEKHFVAQGHVVVHQLQPLGGPGEVASLTSHPSTLTCDRLDADVAKESYTAVGNVHFFETDRDATADRGSFDNGLNRLHLEGDVHIRDGASTLVAESVDYDVTTGVFSAPKRFTLDRDGSRVSGDRGQGNARSQFFTAQGNVTVDRAPAAGATGMNARESHLSADSLDVNGASKVYVATGNVRFSQGDRSAAADAGTLDDLRHVLDLSGDVVIHDGDRTLAADAVNYNTNTGAARARGNVIASSPDSRFTSQAADYNVRTGNFSTPSRFTAVHGGTSVQGDRASGNVSLKSFVATGNVVLHQTRGAGRGIGSFARRPATLTADRLDADGAKHVYIATGHAHYSQTGIVEQFSRDAVADRMVYDEGRDKLHLEGNVKVVDGKTTLTAKQADYDVASGSFVSPERFSLVREATEVQGDKGAGNTKTLKFTVTGDVVINQTGPLRNHGDISELTEQPSTLTTDRLDVDGVKQYYVATGHVHFTQVEREATSQHGTLDDRNHQLHMDGNVKLRDGDRHLDADVVDYNTKTGDVHASGNVVARAPGSEFVAPAPAASASPAPKKKR